GGDYPDGDEDEAAGLVALLPAPLEGRHRDDVRRRGRLALSGHVGRFRPARRGRLFGGGLAAVRAEGQPLFELAPAVPATNHVKSPPLKSDRAQTALRVFGGGRGLRLLHD